MYVCGAGNVREEVVAARVTYMYVCMHVCMYGCVYVWVCVCMGVYVCMWCRKLP